MLKTNVQSFGFIGRVILVFVLFYYSYSAQWAGGNTKRGHGITTYNLLIINLQKNLADLFQTKSKKGSAVAGMEGIGQKTLRIFRCSAGAGIRLGGVGGIGLKMIRALGGEPFLSYSNTPTLSRIVPSSLTEMSFSRRGLLQNNELGGIDDKINYGMRIRRIYYILFSTKSQKVYENSDAGSPQI